MNEVNVYLSAHLLPYIVHQQCGSCGSDKSAYTGAIFTADLHDTPANRMNPWSLVECSRRNSEFSLGPFNDKSHVLEYFDSCQYCGYDSSIDSCAMYWSPRLGYRSLLFFVVDSVCLSVTNIVSSFLFLNEIEPFLGHRDKNYKTLCFDFWFRPKRSKFTPQNLHKIAYKSACMADKPEMFAPTRGFSGMADSMEPCKMLWDRPLLPWQQHLA